MNILELRCFGSVCDKVEEEWSARGVLEAYDVCAYIESLDVEIE